MHDLLDDGQIQEYLSNLIKSKCIEEKYKDILINRLYTIQRIYGLCKFHESDKPLRPLINYINNITKKLLNPALNNLNIKNTYDVKNLIQVREKIKSLNKIYGTECLVSYDAESLLTDVLLNELYKIL